jgi:hypothetical protein
MKTKITLATLLMLPLLFTGCASILDGGAKPVQINSNPEGAKVTISDQEGTQVCVTNTPAIVILARSAGYFRGETYKVHFEKEGYYPFDASIVSELDGWYIGNIFLGGLIGEIIVDPSTGDMFTLAPRKVDCNLISMNTTTTLQSGQTTSHASATKLPAK